MGVMAAIRADEVDAAAVVALGRGVVVGVAYIDEVVSAVVKETCAGEVDDALDADDGFADLAC